MTFVRFRLLILGGFLAIVASVSAASVIVVGRFERESVEADLRSGLEITRAVFTHLLARRAAQMQTAARLLGADYAFQRTLATRDAATIASNAESLKTRIGADAVWLTDEKGRLYADTTGGAKRGRPLTALAAVRDALDGRDGASVDVVRGVAYQLAAVPITASENLGILVVGFRLNDASTAELRRLTGTDVSLAAGGKVFASTLIPASRRELERGLAGVKPGEIALLKSAAGQPLVLAAAVSPEVTAFLQRSRDEALEPARRLSRMLVVLNLAGLGLTALVGLFVTSGVTASIQRLVETTRRLNEELTQTNRFQSQFFSVVAHDVTSPLTAAMGFSEMLSTRVKQGGDPVLLKYAETISKSMDALHFLVSDLVDFAAIENGKLRINLQPLDLVPVLKDIQTRMGVIAEKKSVGFEAVYPESLPKISGDARRLSQVLQNLCSNGINYTPAKGRVRLSAEVRDGAVKLSVKDSGIGIAPQDLPKIFNRFFQAENATKHRGAGLGLGLKIAREIVEAHKGRIEVASVLGQGSEFFFAIPVLPS